MTARDALQALYQHYRPLIATMPERFSSHEFILKLAQGHQREYVAALVEYSDSGEPFRVVHQQLSRHFRFYPDLVEYLGDGPSVDIFGKSNSCAFWKRLG
ncbi:hypothetical protein [Ramlibacter alkalitolerans]|uniref:Uncharacterized protein n=1 Tax=Ramlibacter alkalitolerans TaxID=2039631 RepID=A0ABS1JX32_9BURK|nr:hypothetical protein [Ramlibacter alkalitolerans]MBL0428752.1 hypothetical protein [Ramlibacter alkalitolerans]